MFHRGIPATRTVRAPLPGRLEKAPEPGPALGDMGRSIPPPGLRVPGGGVGGGAPVRCAGLLVPSFLRMAFARISLRFEGDPLLTEASGVKSFSIL